MLLTVVNEGPEWSACVTTKRAVADAGRQELEEEETKSNETEKGPARPERRPRTLGDLDRWWWGHEVKRRATRNPKLSRVLETLPDPGSGANAATPVPNARW